VADPAHVLFAHLAQRSDEDIDLAAAALLIAEPEYPGLDVAHYLAMIDAMADVVRRRGARTPDAMLAEVTHYLFEELGFRGNDDDYYDPKNSFLNEVLDRRVGIPITLSLVLIEVGRRLGLELHGVSFPGHFLVRYVSSDGDRVLDPYHGGVALDQDEIEDRLRQALGQGAVLLPEHLQISTRKQVLTRMLNNLRGIYQRKGDAERELAALEKLAVLNPKDERVTEAADLLRKRAKSGGTGMN
jgi:regulator of sirC expression with transglutaminase-like and TPR domain